MKGFSKFGPNGVRLVLDPNDDQTPCMVYLKNESATYFCALSEGMDGLLTEEQLEWLATFEDYANEFYNKYTHNR